MATNLVSIFLLYKQVTATSLLVKESKLYQRLFLELTEKIEIAETNAQKSMLIAEAEREKAVLAQEATEQARIIAETAKNEALNCK